MAPNGTNLPQQRIRYPTAQTDAHPGRGRVAATRANARMRLRVLGTLFGRRDDSQYNRAAREEARFREAEWDNYNCHGPRGHAQYHHGFEHCI